MRTVARYSVEQEIHPGGRLRNLRSRGELTAMGFTRGFCAREKYLQKVNLEVRST